MERPTLAQVQARVGDLRIPKPPNYDVEGAFTGSDDEGFDEIFNSRSKTWS